LDVFNTGLDNRKVVLPPAYRPAAGRLRVQDKGDHLATRVELTGTYHGLPVKAFERFSGKENGIAAYVLVLAVPKRTAEQQLNRVRYRPDAESGNSVVISGDAKATNVVCDWSN
jgi:hypothetical protein